MSSSSMSRDGGAYRRAGLTVALALAALAALPSVALADDTVATSGTTITVTDNGEANNLTTTQTAVNSYTFTETGSGVTIGNGTISAGTCTDNGNNVVCSGVAWTSVVINLSSGADVFTAAGVNDDPFTINGGDDDDGNIIGSSANDIINGEGSSDRATATGLSGGPGNDTIDGGSGGTGDIINGNAGNDILLGGSDGADTINGGDDNDTLFGGDNGSDDLNGDAGNDRLDGGPGDYDDDYDGGTGIDRVVFGIISGHTYTCTSQAVVVTMDNSGNDSSCGNSSADNQNVRDSVESITGSTLGDTITGSCFANTIAGDPGSATGDAGGNDILNGDPTAVCTAAAGSTDFFGGGEGNDTFNGDGTIDGTHFRGFDTVTYGFPYTGAVTSSSCAVSSVNYAVRVTFDDVANDCDGFGNTTDNVNGDIERLIGSGVADNIDATAADQAVSLFGRVGNDVLTDGPFGDFLNGEVGADTINCTNTTGGNGGTDTNVVDANDTVNGDCEIDL
jgi:hypothetical protein